MFLPFLPLIIASLGLSLLVLPMLPDEAVIPRTNRNLDPASDQQSVAWAVAVSIKQTLDSSVPKMGCCRTLGGFELGHPLAY